MSKVYIAGPMTGRHGMNRTAFMDAAEGLAAKGWIVKNPADHTLCLALEDMIRDDVAELITCDAIYMLLGWEKSVGARAEHAIAVWLGIRIMYELLCPVVGIRPHPGVPHHE